MLALLALLAITYITYLSVRFWVTVLFIVINAIGDIVRIGLTVLWYSLLCSFVAFMFIRIFWYVLALV